MNPVFGTHGSCSWHFRKAKWQLTCSASGGGRARALQVATRSRFPWRANQICIECSWQICTVCTSAWRSRTVHATEASISHFSGEAWEPGCVTESGMAPPARAEVALVQLRSCLVNLPAPLVSVLANANVVGCLDSAKLGSMLIVTHRPPKMSSLNSSIGHRRCHLAQFRAQTHQASRRRLTLDGLACPASPDPLE